MEITDKKSFMTLAPGLVFIKVNFSVLDKLECFSIAIYFQDALFNKLGLQTLD